MVARSKRTYSLRPETLTRVRELAARYQSSQDALVDAAVERLYREAREQDDAAAWAAAADDAEFQQEARGLAEVFDEAGSWPA
jgi:predicted transcriptional regulator